MLFLLLQGYCSFKSFWLLSSECPCAPLMGLIWYSALMPSLIFVCETKCFDGGWLLKRLCVYRRLLFFFVFLFQWRVSFMASHSTVHFVPSAQNKNTVDWILDSLHHPSLLPAALLSANSVCVSERDRDACVLCVHTRVLKVNYCKRLPINLLSWKFERYCRTYKLINTCANIMLSHKHTVSYTHTQTHH